MGLPAATLDDDVLPPELTLVDDAPLTDDDLDEFARYLAMVADSVGCTQEEALDLVWEPPADVELPPMPPAIEAFGRVVDEARVDWAMASYGRAERALKKAEAKRDAYRDQIDRWFSKEANRIKSDRSYFGMLLEAFGRARRTDKVMSWNLPTGTIKSRKANVGGKISLPKTADAKREVVAWLESSVGAEWLQEHIDTVVAACEAVGIVGEQLDAVRIFATTMALHLVVDDPYDGAVKVERTPLADGIKAHVSITDGRACDPVTGDPVPGLGVEPEGVKYTITPA